MAANSSTAPQAPPAQTPEEIIATLRAERAKTDSTFFNVLRSIPLMPLGGMVDLGNAVAGTLAGKGFLQPLVDKPVGGMKQLKEMFKIPEIAPDNTLGQVMEAAAGMTSPGGMAKAIIIPFTAAQATRAGVSKIADQALRTYAKTGNNYKVLEESNKALKNANFPMAIEGLFVGPDMKLRASLSNEAFKSNFNKQLFTVDPTTNSVVLSGAMLGGQNTIRAQTVMPHESLYTLMPELKGTRIRHDPTLDAAGNIAGSYNIGANIIGLPKNIQMGTAASPLQELVNTVTHEMSHGAAAYGGTRSGSATNVKSLTESINEAKSMGSFSSRPQLDEVLTTLDDIEWAKAFPELASSKAPVDPDAYVIKTYKNIYGEVEARQGEKMGLPNIKRLESSY